MGAAAGGAPAGLGRRAGPAVRAPYPASAPEPDAEPAILRAGRPHDGAGPHAHHVRGHYFGVLFWVGGAAGHGGGLRPSRRAGLRAGLPPRPRQAARRAPALPQGRGRAHRIAKPELAAHYPHPALAGAAVCAHDLRAGHSGGGAPPLPGRLGAGDAAAQPVFLLARHQSPGRAGAAARPRRGHREQAGAHWASSGFALRPLRGVRPGFAAGATARGGQLISG